MSDFDFPELPSDEELGITKEDREAYEEEAGAAEPELSEAELAALLGDTPSPGGSKAAKEDPKKSGRAAKKAEKEARKAAKKAEKEAQRAAKEAKKKAAGAAAAAGAGASKKGASKAGAGAAAGSGAAGQPDDSKAARQAEKAAAAEAKAARKSEKANAAEANRPVQPAAPRKKWLGPLTLGVMFGAAVLASGRTGLPDPVPANAPDTVFSSARAMTTLIDIARAPHPPGAPEHARVREYLVDRLEELGFETHVQTTQSMVQRGGFTRAATVRNVVGRLPGTSPNGALLLTAHYDGREHSHGAGDDGSGVVAILEAVRASEAIGLLENDVIVLFTDAEELGLLGARAFVNEHPYMEAVSLVLSFEMRGGGGPSIMFETREENGWIIRELADFDPHPFANSMSYEVYQRMPNDTDFTPFREAGVQGLNFAAIDNAHVYHQSSDRPENLSESTLQHHGIRALAALRHFGNMDLTEVSAPNVVYFSVPVLGLIVYERFVVFALAAVIALLVGLATLLSVRRGARPGRIVGGVVLSLVSVGLSAGVAIGVLRLIERYHAEFGTLHGSAIHSEGWYLVAIAAAAFTIVVTVSLLARRWFHLSELALGALVLPAVGAIAVAFVAPLAAMNLQWPVIAAALALLALAALGPRVQAPVGAIGTALAAGVVLLIMTPVVELLWLALSIRLAVPLAILIAVAVQLCLPVVDNLRHPNDWWSPALGLVVVGAGLGLGVLSARPSAERPAPSTLLYAYEHGSGSAWWTSDPTEDGLDEDAAAWTEDRAGEALDERLSLEPFAVTVADVPATPAPIVDAPRPAVLVTRDDLAGRTRIVDLRVRSRIGAELIQFRPGASGSTRITSINGVEIEAPGDLVSLEHWGEPAPFITLEVETGADEPIDLHVVEHLLRPWELLGEEAFERPAELALNVNRLSDRAIFRYSVADFADPRHAIFEIDPAPELMGDSLAPAAATGAPQRSDSTSATPADSGATPPDPAATPGDAAATPAALDSAGAAAGVADSTATGDSAAVDSAAVVDTTVAVDTTGTAGTTTVVDPADTTAVADTTGTSGGGPGGSG